VNTLPQGVRAVVFDAVGTLIHPEPPAVQVYTSVGRRFGSRLTAEEIMPRFRTAFAEEEARDRALHWRTSEPRELERWRNIVGRVLDDVANAAACFRELFEHFRRPDAWRLEADTAEVLRTLGCRGYRLGLASNFDSRLRSVLAGIPALEPIERIAISSEIGWRKPAPEFFTALSALLQEPAVATLFLGNDPENDYAGASAAGLHALLFDPRCREAGANINRIMRLGELLTEQPPSYS
jgi:putative hydrolase of the HAD superfamily